MTFKIHHGKKLHFFTHFIEQMIFHLIQLYGARFYRVLQDSSIFNEDLTKILQKFLELPNNSSKKFQVFVRILTRFFKIM